MIGSVKIVAISAVIHVHTVWVIGRHSLAVFVWYLFRILSHNQSIWYFFYPIVNGELLL